MEFRRARLDEQPNRGLVERFEREIVPLLHERRRFAEATDFRLYDLRTDGGVAEDVFAFSNGRGGDRSLVVYHNRFASVAGWIRESVEYAVKASDGSKSLRRSSLADALELSGDDGAFVAFRDARSGLEFIRSGRELHERGLFVELDAYRGLVFGGFRELREAPDAAWSELAARLAGRGVPSLDDALADLRLAPIHALVAALLEPDLGPAETARRRSALLEAAGVAGATPARVPTTAKSAVAAPSPTPARRAVLDPAVRAATLLEGLDRATFDRLRLHVPLRAAGLDDWEILRARVALGLARPSQVRDARRLADAWFADGEVRAFLGVNEWEGVEWFGREAFDSLLELVADLERAAGVLRVPAVLAKLRAAADRGGYGLADFLAELGAASAPTRRQPS
jgi:hypothetical protein